MKKAMRQSDGKYHMSGRKFDMLEGSRAQVWHSTAYKTAGDLKKGDLLMNKHGRIVSRRKHATAKKERRLEKAGYKTVKGKFGFVKDGAPKKRKTARRGRKGSRKR